MFTGKSNKAGEAEVPAFAGILTVTGDPIAAVPSLLYNCMVAVDAPPVHINPMVLISSDCVAVKAIPRGKALKLVPDVKEDILPPIDGGDPIPVST
jgi:hypothetical protein